MSVRPHDEPACAESSEPAVELEIEARTRSIGAFAVRRLLHSPRRRMVGPLE